MWARQEKKCCTQCGFLERSRLTKQRVTNVNARTEATLLFLCYVGLGIAPPPPPMETRLQVL